ncbi:RHS repeat domain-containing protein [Brevifollis gellanilyticus]|uniref:Uncharacterized protein n=1 Tax=Brevifollis gellanilyticus TaxID=748831 RepID=A0A512M664_9BACT|nr:RHS repeat-associated core domain-containing protein [Brevifollis gellanilyticus]GEP42219.1 hypothetical protein BGE01nite_15100 [Brevifollis gellanilyticus]
MKTPPVLFLILPLALMLGRGTSSAGEPGDYWLKRYNLHTYEWDWDHDADGFTTWEEYLFGTHPRQATSIPPSLISAGAPGSITISWPSSLGARYEIEQTVSLVSWTSLSPTLNGTGALMSQNFTLSGGRGFYRLGALEPLDVDGDGLSSLEEGILGTNVLLADTDGDTLSDGAEIYQTFTNPLVANPQGGTIRGVVKTDPNGDGNTADGQALQGTSVYLDTNFNGEFDSDEPVTETNVSGQYEFTHLLPGVYPVRQVLAAGQLQTLPAPGASPVLNRLPDEVVNYTHGVGGDFAVPYGIPEDTSVVVPQIAFRANQPLDPAITLKPIGRRGNLPPTAVWSYNEYLSIPETGSITWRFDERIIDRPGTDLIIHVITQGVNEEATIQLGLTNGTLQNAGTIIEQLGASSTAIPIDLGTRGVTGVVQYVKITSTSSQGASQGFDLVGAEAVNFARPRAGSIELVIAGNEVYENQNFGRHFRDDPPDVFLFVDGAEFRAGQSAPVQVLTADDIGIASRGLTANGAAISLNAEGEGTVPLPTAGAVQLVATVTDTGGHTTTEEATVYVLNADGSSPFNLNLTGAGVEGTLDARVITPYSGAILTNNTPVVVTIEGLATPHWVLDYAPVALIDPYNMPAADPDWVSIASGTGYLANQSAGTLPIATLPNGIYFLRLRATPTGGGATVYRGQVFAKGVNAEDIQPRVTITSPAQGSTAGLVTPIMGSITSTRPLVEWFAEYAPANMVDLNDLGSSEPPWKRIAQGTTTITNNVIARLDTSLIPDGSYIVRITAWNDIRLGWAEPLPIEVAGTVKLGRLRREFTDLSLPVGGIPFVIRRVYDSLDAERDQGLGHGWSLAFLNPDVKETVADTGSGMFGNTPFREGTRVYVNTPGGKRAGFTFHAEFGVGGLFGAVYKAEFIADPGVYETLEVPEGNNPFLAIDSNGDVFLSFLGTAWNPSVYILTTPDGTRYTYDEDSGFREARDRNGNVLSATASGLRHSTGAAITFTRDGNNRITQIQAPDGVIISYGYDAAGDLVTVTDDDNRVTEMSYHANPAHFLKDVSDPLGRVGVTYEYDAGGKLVAIIDANGERSELDLDPGAFTGTLTDRRGNVTSLVYDERGNVTSETNALNQTTTFEFNDPANPDRQTKRTDARGNVQTWQYNAHGHVTQMIRPSSHFNATYNADGKMLTRRTFNGETATYTYDAKGNLATASEPGKPAGTYSYTPEGKLATLASPNPAGGPDLVTTYEHNAQGRLSAVRSPFGFAAQTIFTGDGNMTNATLAGGRTFSFAYDAQGVPTQQTDPYNHSKSSTLLPNGTRRDTDRLGRTTDYLTTEDGRIDKITLPGGSSTSVLRDEERNVTSITDAANNTTSWQYDALNRLTRFTDPTGAFATIAYDTAGNVTEIINRNGKRRTFTYDSSNRVTHERWHDGTGAVIRDITVTYQFDDSISVITDSGGTWDFAGPLPRPGAIGVTYPGQVRKQIAYSWGANDAGGSGGCCGAETVSDNPAPTQMLVTGGADFFRIIAEYKGPNLQRLLWSPPNNFFGPTLDFYRNANNALTEIRRYHNGGPMKSRTSYTWDLLGRLTNITHTDGAGVPLNPEAPAVLTRDAESRITSIARASDTATHTFDPLDQLTAVTHTGGVAESYTYNTMGVRTSSHLIPGPSTVGTGNRLLTTGTLSFTHDAEGNVTEKTDSASGQVTRYSYDHRSQLVQATLHANAVAPASTTVEFAYDYAGRMISRSLNGAKTWILYDREMPLAEFADGANAVNAAFLYDPSKLDTFYGVWRQGSSERLLFTDHIGTVQGAMSAEGSMVFWASYDAFGNLIGAAPPGIDTLRFAGRFYNEALGLYEMRSRYYDPRLGRFTQEDPLGLKGGDMNLYRYAGNNPVMFRDPTGQNAALEYIELIVGIVRPGALCSYASCVSNLWAGVANAVIFQVGSTGKPKNCALELFGIPTSLPRPLGAATLGFGYGSNFGVSAPPGTGLAVEALSVMDCLLMFGQ